MPRQFLPRKSGQHRIACKALYRALLSQCPRIPIPADLATRGPINPLKHLIRKQFRNNVWETSPRIVLAALKNGYAVETLLRNAGDGQAAAISQVLSLLRERHEKVISQKASQLPPKPKPSVRYPEPYPSTPQLLDIRPVPLSKLSGPRHVPVLAKYGACVFLRLSKRHNPFLSRMLQDKSKLKNKRLDQKAKMEWLVEMGQWENEWEELVRGMLESEGKGDSDWGDGGWEEGPEGVEEMLVRKVEADDKKDMERAMNLTMIWSEEKELWEKERKERKHLKNLEKLARKKGAILKKT